MYLILNFPICDLRHFVKDKSDTIRMPRWEVPILDFHRIKFFGTTKRRRLKLDTLFTDELYFIDSNSVFNFEGNTDAFSFLNPIYIGKRLYLGDYKTLHFEVSFVFKEWHSFWKNRNKFIFPWPDLIKDTLYRKIKIKQKQGVYIDSILMNLGKKIKDLYHLATSADSSEASDKYIFYGIPIIILSFNGLQSKAILPKHAIRIPSELIGDIDFSVWDLKVRGKQVFVGFLKHNGENELITRNFQINFVRIHSEIETLKRILNSFKSNEKVILAGEKLEYLNKITEKLFVPENLDLSNTNYAIKAYQKAFPEFDILKNKTFTILSESRILYKSKVKVEIIDYIENDNLESALSLISTIPQLNNEVVLIKNRLSRLKKRHIIGFISREDYAVQYTRIVASILELIQD